VISGCSEIENLDKLNTGDHTVLLYENETEIIASSASFIKTSLSRNEKCLYIEGDAQTELLIEELKKQITDLDRYLANGKLQILSKEETYALSDKFEADQMIELLKEKSLKAVEEGYNGLSITGELSWVLNFKDGKEEIIAYEWKLNKKIFNKYPTIAMCRYNLNKFDNDIIKSIIELHHYIIWKGKIHENPYYIDPEGYRDNKIVEYEIDTWLKNIQEYKKRESRFKEKLKNKENEYEFLFNKINDAVYLQKIDVNNINNFNNFVKVNDTACEMLGYSREELLNMSPKDIDINFQSQEDANNLFEQFDCTFENNKEIDIETEHISSSGEIIPVELNSNFYEHNGQHYILTIARDISSRKEKEEELIKTKDTLQIKNESLEANNEEIRAMNEALDNYINEINELNMRFIKLIELFSNNDHLNYGNEKEFLTDILETAFKVIPEADYGSVYKYEDGKVNFINVIGYNLDELNKLNLPVKSFYNLKDDIEVISHEEIKDRNKELMGSSNHNNLNQMHQIKELLRMDLQMFGKKKLGLNLDIDAKNNKEFKDNSIKIFRVFQNIATSFYTLREYNNLQKSFTKELITSIIKLLEMHDLYTKGHSENVADLASKITEQMGLSKKLIDDSYWAGLVHDIGKLLIPLDILNKKNRLTEEEYELIKKHPLIGSRALESSDSLKHIAKYVRYHHERWDGRGYPEGLAADEIPLISQILQVADSWDAMTSERSYREALSTEAALNELKINRGSQFSPKVVDFFLEILEKKRITTVKY
jgi:PAS domain S-box-containing protein